MTIRTSMFLTIALLAAACSVGDWIPQTIADGGGAGGEGGTTGSGGNDAGTAPAGSGGGAASTAGTGGQNGTGGATPHVDAGVGPDAAPVMGTGGTTPDAGPPPKALGTPCAGDSECQSHACTNGVCCGSADCGTCNSCGLAASAGSCAPIARLVSDQAHGCTGSAVCDGTGHCSQLKPLGASCAASSECESRACTDGVCCGSLDCGTCESCSLPGSSGSCAPIRRYASDPAHACIGTNTCDGSGHCMALKVLGTACSSSAECQSGSCTNGVCCGSADCGTCGSCALPGSLGACVAIPAGMPDPAHGCSGANTCDGANRCFQPKSLGAICGSSAECASGSCTNGVCCGSADCGTCGSCALPGSPGTCAPIPRASADPLHSCAGANACDGSGHCLRALGQSCSTSSSCASGFCVDGVCCQSACNGQCQSCNQAGSAGTCSPLPRLAQDSSPSCTGDWACDGRGGCGKKDGTACDGTCLDTCLTFWRDSDRDGFGANDPGSTLAICGDSTHPTPPTGYITPNGRPDCCDADARVHPGQTQFFATPASACSSPWDYDCDGLIETNPITFNSSLCTGGLPTIGVPVTCPCSSCPGQYATFLQNTCGGPPAYQYLCTFLGNNQCEVSVLIDGGLTTLQCR